MGLALGGVILLFTLLFAVMEAVAFLPIGLVLSVACFFHYRYYPPQTETQDALLALLYIGLLFAPMIVFAIIIGSNT